MKDLVNFTIFLEFRWFAPLPGFFFRNKSMLIVCFISFTFTPSNLLVLLLLPDLSLSNGELLADSTEYQSTVGVLQYLTMSRYCLCSPCSFPVYVCSPHYSPSCTSAHFQVFVGYPGSWIVASPIYILFP